jgi:putative hydrolase of HD superfamily
LDRLKVFEYLIYHDVPEVYAGDAKFNNPEEMRLKQQKEEKAIEKILSFIPNPDRFSKILTEYEHRETRESEFAKAIDCIDSCIRNLNDDQIREADGFDEALIRNKYKPHVSKFQVTNQLFEELIKRLVALKKI